MTGDSLKKQTIESKEQGVRNRGCVNDLRHA